MWVESIAKTEGSKSNLHAKNSIYRKKMGSIFSTSQPQPEQRKLTKDERLLETLQCASRDIPRMNGSKCSEIVRSFGYSERTSHIIAFLLADKIHKDESQFTYDRPLALSVISSNVFPTLARIIDNGKMATNPKDPYIRFLERDFITKKYSKKELLLQCNDHLIFINGVYKSYAIVSVNGNPVKCKNDIKIIQSEVVDMCVVRIRHITPSTHTLKEMKLSQLSSRRRDRKECLRLKHDISDSEFSDRKSALNIPTYCSQNTAHLFTDVSESLV